MLFVILILAIVGVGEALKVFRTPVLLSLVLVAAIYARHTMLRKQNLPLLFFTMWGMLYVGLSFLHVFSPAWTRYYDQSVILQQASFLAVLLPMVAASQKWWEDPRYDSSRDVVLILIVLFAFFIGVAFDIAFLGFGETSFRPSATLRNYVLLGLLALSYLVFRSPKWRPYALLVLLAVFGWSVTHPLFMQNTIVYLIIFGFLAAAMVRIPADRLMLVVFLVLLTTATIVGLQDPFRVFEIDPNSGWRLAWWKDAFEATLQTGGVGVGYGTESLRNEYAELLQRDSYREEGGTFLLVGTHSAFFDTNFRTGFVGVSLLFLIIFRCFPHANTPPLARAHCCAMFAIMVLCLHSNLGLQSPMYSLGVAICIGYLQSERHKAVLASAAHTRVPGAASYAGSLARP